MLFFVCTKALELLAIPLMAVVSLAWVPIGLPLLLLGGIVQTFDSQLGHILVRCGIWPFLGTYVMWSSTLGSGTGDYCKSEDHSSTYMEPDMDLPKSKLCIPTGRKIAQFVGILTTTLALAAAVVTVILFFATALVPLTFLWPMAIACGCVALIGLIAYGIARHGDWWETFADMPLRIKMRVHKRIVAIDNHPYKWNQEMCQLLNILLQCLSQCDENTSQNKWKRIADALEILPRDDFEACLSGAENNPVLPLFQYCKYGDVLVRVLKLFRKRLPSKILWERQLMNSHGELYKKIAARASENEAVRQAWNKLLRHAGPKPAELN